MGERSPEGYRKETEIVHGEIVREKSFGAISPPIYQSSTFVFESAEHGRRIFTGESDGFVYTRYGNPTTEILEKRMARLEHTEAAAAFSSGLAAEMAIFLTLVHPGENIIADEVLYGGSHAMFKNDLPELGIEVRRCDTTDQAELRSLIDEKTKMIFIETPANPTLKIVDIAAVAAVSKEANIPLCVDSTFATPYLQRPIDLGADMVVHSATKYIGGHGDVVAGIVCGASEYIAQIRFKRRVLGSILGPFNSWLLLRGLKTLALRVKKGSENAMEIAQFLHGHPKVRKVFYPGLPTDKYFETAKKQMDMFGAMISFDVVGGVDAGRTIMDNVKVCTLAVSLGDVDTLIQHPASMTHSSYTAAELGEAFITPGMIRLSVGIEDAQDIIDDLSRCLDMV